MAAIDHMIQRRVAVITRFDVAMAERSWFCCLCHRQFENLRSVNGSKGRLQELMAKMHNYKMGAHSEFNTFKKKLW